MHRQHRVVAGVVGVVHGRPVGDAPSSPHRVVVGDRDRLVVGDQEAVEGAFQRRPGAHAGGGARPQQVDRRVAADLVPAAVRRQRLLVRAPAQLGRLAAFADEAVDRPGVDELARLLGRSATWVSRSAIWITLMPSAAPAPPSPRAVAGRCASTPVSRAMSSIACLTKCADQARDSRHASVTAVGPLRAGRRSASAALAHRVVRALATATATGRCSRPPGLDAGVEVEHAALLAELRSAPREDTSTDRLSRKSPGAEQRRQHVTVVVPRRGLTTNSHAVFGRDLMARAPRP